MEGTECRGFRSIKNDHFRDISVWCGNNPGRVWSKSLVTLSTTFVRNLGRRRTNSHGSQENGLTVRRLWSNQYDEGTSLWTISRDKDCLFWEPGETGMEETL